MNTLSVFVPTFNESNNISGTLDCLKEAISVVNGLAVQIIVIDDASTDDTVRKIESWTQAHNFLNIELIIKSKNLGLGDSYRQAFRISSSDYFMYVPGDDVITSGDLIKLFSAVGESDLVIPYFGDLDFRSQTRLLVSLTFTKLMKVFSGIDIPYFNGPTISKVDLLRKYFPELNGFSSQAEFLCLAIKDGNTYATIQITNHERSNGDSKAITLRNIFLAAYCFLRVFYYCRLKRSSR